MRSPAVAGAPVALTAAGLKAQRWCSAARAGLRCSSGTSCRAAGVRSSLLQGSPPLAAGLLLLLLP